jgi:hypothetical protein
MPSYLGINLINLQCLYYWFTGEFEDLTEAVEKGLELASRTGIHVLDAWFLSYGAVAALCSGDVEAADPFLRKMTARLDQPAFHPDEPQPRSWSHLIGT